ncbi:hypothetical protein GCM10027290_63460 [Micromonospora sonneratiae]|uniref:Lipoprotein n=1 Tax=Micromonospora sonneratiae TaxID=1184706 RepID=A0ABW3YKN5_9ACTN
MKARTLLLALAMPAVMALAACGQAAAGQPAARQPDPAVSDWPNQGRLTEWATTVEREGQQNHPEVYAGVEINLDADTVIVHRIPSATFDEAIRRLLPPAATVRYIDATYSEQQLADWTAAVTADTDYWRQRGIELHLIGTKPGQCVLIGIDNPARDTTSITARYPARPICVEHASGAVPLTGNGQN